MKLVPLAFCNYVKPNATKYGDFIVLNDGTNELVIDREFINEMNAALVEVDSAVAP